MPDQLELKQADGPGQGPAEQKVQHTGVHTGALQHAFAQVVVVTDQGHQFIDRLGGGVAVVRMLADVLSQLRYPGVIAAGLVLGHQLPKAVHIAQQGLAGQAVDAVQGGQGGRLFAGQGAALQGTMRVYGAGVVRLIKINAGRRVGRRGFQLDNVGFRRRDAVGHVVVSRFTLSDGEQVLQRQFAVHDQQLIIRVEGRAPFATAGAAPAAMKGMGGDHFETIPCLNHEKKAARRVTGRPWVFLFA